jgi:hypothetical protein
LSLWSIVCTETVLEPNRKGRIPEKGKKKANAISERDASVDA